jgi:hypothetical protein
MSPPTYSHQPFDRDEQRSPAGIRISGDQDVARFEIRLRDVQDDARTSLDRPGGDRQADERAGRKITAPIRARDSLAI